MRKDDTYAPFMNDEDSLNDTSLKSQYKSNKGKLEGYSLPTASLVTAQGWLTSSGREELIRMIIELMQTLNPNKLYNYQIEAASAILREFLLDDAEEMCLLFSRQSGKTETLANVMAALLIIIERLAPSIKDLERFKHGLKIGYFAGTGYQVDTIFDRTFNFLDGEIGLEILNEIDSKKRTKGKMLKVGKSYIFAKTAAKQSKVESKSYDVLVADECLASETMVSAVKHPIKIKDIKVGDKVYGWDKVLGIVEDTVTNVWNRGARETFRLTLDNGRYIDATLNHKIWTSAGWLTVEDLLDMDISSYKVRGSLLSYANHVASIMYVGIREVWDIATELSHTFFANEILVHNCQDIDAQMLRKCYAEDTLVMTENGRYVPIKEIFDKRLPVYGYTGDTDHILLPKDIPNNIELFRSVEYWNNDIQDVYRISFDNGKFLDVTLNHIHLIYCNHFGYSYLTTEDLCPYMRIPSISDKRGYVIIEDISFFCAKPTYCVTIPHYNHLIITNGGLITSNSLSPMLSATGGMFIKSGTPTTKICELYDACLRTKSKTINSSYEYCDTEDDYRAKVKEIEAEIKGYRKLMTGTFLDEVEVAKSKYMTSKEEHIKELEQKLVRVKDYWLSKAQKRQFYFEVKWEQAAKENPRYKKYVEKEKLRLGENSDDFAMSYNLTWMIDRGMFITSKALQDARLPSESLLNAERYAEYSRICPDIWKPLMSGNLQEEWVLSKTVAGIDWGKTKDSTVVTILWVDWEHLYDGFPLKIVLNWLEIQGDDYESQYDQIDDFLNRYNVARIILDATGVGDPIADRYELMWCDHAEVVPVKLTQKFNSDMFKHWRNEIRIGRFWFPGNDEAQQERVYKSFVAQMEGLQKNWQGGYMQCHNDPKNKEGHDDYCYSTALACYGAREPIDTSIEISNGIYSRRTNPVVFERSMNAGRRTRAWRRDVKNINGLY